MPKLRTSERRKIYPLKGAVVAKPAAANAKPAGIVGGNIEKENNEGAKNVLRRSSGGGEPKQIGGSPFVMTIDPTDVTKNVVPRIILVKMDSVYLSRPRRRKQSWQGRK